MTSQTGKQSIPIHILPISWSKGNQKTKFGQLIEYNMGNIFLEKSYTKCGEEASPRPFSKKSKLSISVDQLSEMLHSLFLLYVQVEFYQKILQLRCWPLALTLHKAFLENKKRSGTSLPFSLSAWFLKENISHVIFN